MIILEKCFKGAIIADHKSQRYLAKETFVRKRDTHSTNYLLNGRSVSKARVLEPIK